MKIRCCSSIDIKYFNNATDYLLFLHRTSTAMADQPFKAGQGVGERSRSVVCGILFCVGFKFEDLSTNLK